MPRILLISPHLRQEGAVAALRVDHMTRALRDSGWDVIALGRHPGAHEDDLVVADPAQRARTWLSDRPSQGLWGKVASAVLFRIIPDEQAFWSAKVARHRPRDRYDAVVVSGPPFSVFVGAASLSKRLGVPLLLDYRDLWTLGGYFDRSGVRAWFERMLERWVWRHAKAATSVSEPLVCELQEASALPRCEVVKNGYDPRLYEGFDFAQPTGQGDVLSIAHLGEIYPGRRDPEPLFRALASDPDLQSRVLLTFHGSNAHTLTAAVERWGLSSCVRLLDRVSLAEALRVQQSSDALLLLLWNSPKEEGVYSGKLFEYIASRRRVLMMGYEDGVAAQLVRERNVGVVANDETLLAETLRSWVAEKASGSWHLNPAEAIRGLDRDSQIELMKPVIEWVAR